MMRVLAAAAALTAAGLTAAAVGVDLAAARPPRVALTASGQGLARSVLLRGSDLPPGWGAVPHFRADPSYGGGCRAYQPDFSRLVLRGLAAAAESRGVPTRSLRLVAMSAAAFATRRQSGRWARLNVTTAERCSRPGMVASSGRVEAFARLTLPAGGLGEAAYRIRSRPRLRTPGSTYNDFFLLGRGRLQVTLVFLAYGQPFSAPLERHVLARVTARMRRH